MTINSPSPIIDIDYLRRTAKSSVLHNLAREFFPGGDTRSVTFFPPYPVFMKAGRGCRLHDVDGNVYLDFLNNYFSLIHGHAHPGIIEAVTQQLDRGTAHAAPTELQIELAKLLCERVPSIDTIRFCNSGTEATMNAIRAAKAFTGRNKIVKMEGGFHGSHDAFEISVVPPLELAGPDDAPLGNLEIPGLFTNVLKDVVVAPFNDIQATSRIIENFRSELAAVIVEPVLGVGGMLPASRDYLAFLRQATTDCGALLVFDEIITFRLAYGGMQEVYDIRPDLTALGKIIGGGLPVGAFGGSREVMSLFDPAKKKLTHGGTFNGNALTMAAGLAAMKLYTPQEIRRLSSVGDKLRDGLSAALSRAGIRAQVTGVGSLAQIHFSESPIRTYRDAARAAKEPLSRLHLALLNRGVFIAPRGQWCLSTVMSDAEIDEALVAFLDALSEI
jgi:glutamate-1-semialdehyde 2,1-aminomutase